MFCCIWWPAGFMVARLVVNNMLGCDGTQWGVGSRPRRGRMCITAGGVPKARNLRMVGWWGEFTACCFVASNLYHVLSMKR